MEQKINEKTKWNSVCQAQRAVDLKGYIGCSVQSFIIVRTAKNLIKATRVASHNPVCKTKSSSQTYFPPVILSSNFLSPLSLITQWFNPESVSHFRGQILSKEPLMIRAALGGACAVMRLMLSWGLRSYASGFPQPLQGHHHGDGRCDDCRYGSGSVHGNGGGHAAAALCWLPESYEAPS